MTKARPKILHLHSTFAAGGKEVRAVALMNAFGRELDHTVVSGESDQEAARALIANGVKSNFPDDFPSLKGLPTPGRLVAIAKAMKPYDLVLTYNWGAMDAVLAHTVYAGALGLPPLIHHEDGFNEDEADGLKLRRNWMRRIALGKTHALVVPSRVLESIALSIWKRPKSQIKRIPNGIDTLAFARKAKPSALPFSKGKDEVWIGTLAGLRAVKQLPLLVEACAKLTENWRLIILGEGPERGAIEAKAHALGVESRVELPGAFKDPSSVIGLFDIFALSSKSEQFPLSVVEAMAAGLPVAAPDVGDVKGIVSEANWPFIVPAGGAEPLAMTLADFAANKALRREIGDANRQKAQSQFDQRNMIEAYRALYWGAMERA